MKRFIIPIVLTVLLTFGGVATSVSAHEGIEHATEAQAKAHTELSVAQLENIISLLKQVVSLIEARNSVLKTTPAPMHDDMHTEDADEHEMDNDMIDDHHDAEAKDDVKKLIIEVEEHLGKTHIHIRYTDKAEDMFFANVALSDEAGIVKAITDRSGLSADVAKAAIKYQ